MADEGLVLNLQDTPFTAGGSARDVQGSELAPDLGVEALLILAVAGDDYVGVERGGRARQGGLGHTDAQGVKKVVVDFHSLACQGQNSGQVLGGATARYRAHSRGRGWCNH